MKYAHGQHAAYVLDRCRCVECGTANTAYEQSRHRALAPPFVSATQAREHLAWLAGQGVGRKQVAKVSGVSGGALHKLIYGDASRGSPPSRRIRVETHDAIMAVTPANIAPGATTVIPAGPSWVLLDEMIAAGVPRSAIAGALGHTSIGLQISRTTVSPVNRDKIRALHARWLTGDWLPVRRDSYGNRRPCPPPPRPAPTPAERATAYADRTELFGALADALEARLERPWRHLAACRGRPSRLWFPQRGDAQTYNAAVKICMACPVRRQCLTANLDEIDGIYGGTGARTRRRLRVELAAHPDAGVMAREHGTVRGYRDHLAGGEAPCARCKAANADSQRERRRTVA
jgi:hypothetical protein